MRDFCCAATRSLNGAGLENDASVRPARRLAVLVLSVTLALKAFHALSRTEKMSFACVQGNRSNMNVSNGALHSWRSSLKNRPVGPLGQSVVNFYLGVRNTAYTSVFIPWKTDEFTRNGRFLITKPVRELQISDAPPCARIERNQELMREGHFLSDAGLVENVLGQRPFFGTFTGRQQQQLLLCVQVFVKVS